ncbi:MAG: hypothetical protein HRT87_09180 [Legionellales bacterium]|nr:hypothetical protein [Legionellales bacterium]
MRSGIYYHKKIDEIFELEEIGEYMYRLKEKDNPTGEGQIVNILQIELSGTDKYWVYIGSI